MGLIASPPTGEINSHASQSVTHPITSRHFVIGGIGYDRHQIQTHSWYRKLIHWNRSWQRIGASLYHLPISGEYQLKVNSVPFFPFIDTHSLIMTRCSMSLILLIALHAVSPVQVNQSCGVSYMLSTNLTWTAWVTFKELTRMFVVARHSCHHPFRSSLASLSLLLHPNWSLAQLVDWFICIFRKRL